MDYSILASKEIVAKTAEALTGKGYHAFIVENKIEALEKVKSLIPQGASIQNGSSRTLEQIGFVDYLKAGQHGWNNLHEAILAEKDPIKQGVLRKQATLSDYYLGSVHAMIENGEFIIASNTGSQLPNIVFSSQNLVFVVGTQKIVPNLDEAMKRLHEYVMPLEDENMHQKFGVGTQLSKLLVFKEESKFNGRTVNIILVSEKLGF